MLRPTPGDPWGVEQPTETLEQKKTNSSLKTAIVSPTSQPTNFCFLMCRSVYGLTQYIDKKPSCQPDMVALKIQIIWLKKR